MPLAGRFYAPPYPTLAIATWELLSMSTPSDLTQTGEQLLFALLNDVNPTPARGTFSPANVSLGLPLPLSGHPSGHNTQLVITGIPGQGYSGQTTVTFNRLNLADVFTDKGASTLSFMNASDGYTDSHSFLDHLNTTFALNLQPTDVVHETLPAPDGTTQEIAYTLQAHADSLTYQGTMPLTITPYRVMLTMAVKALVLPGFTATDAKAASLTLTLTNNQLDGLTVADVTGP